MIQPARESAAASGTGISENVWGNSVLVLNRFYMPLQVISVRRSMIMLYRNAAEVIHLEDSQYFNYDFAAWVELSQFVVAEYGDAGDREFIRCVRFPIEVPRVVRLYLFDKVPRQVVRFNRRNLLARDNHQCQFCGRFYGNSHLSLDHVLPRSRGGQTTWENVVCSCLRCNGRKGNRTPGEANMRLLRDPFRPSHSPLMSRKLDNPRYHSWRAFLGKSESESGP